MPKKALLGPLSDTDIRLLTVYRTVVESGGFSAAELELNINRSTISRHMKDLETRLGVTLCQRGRSGFLLTSEGEVIYQSALRLFTALDKFRTEASEVHHRMKGELVVGFSDNIITNPANHINIAIREMHDIAPEVTVSLHVQPLNVIEQKVMEREFHLGIIPRHRSSPSLNYLFLFDEEMHLYIGQGHSLWSKSTTAATAQVQACDYVALGFHSVNMDISRDLGLIRTARAFNQEAVAALIMSGRYTGFLPDHYARHFISQGMIRPLRPDYFCYQCNFSAITSAAGTPARILGTFLRHLRHAHNTD